MVQYGHGKYNGNLYGDHKDKRILTMQTVTKKDIRMAFHGSDEHYHIETIKRGKTYRIYYDASFDKANIQHSIISQYISHWMVQGRIFIVSVK